MILTNIELTNSLTLCSVLISSVTMISLFLKLSGYKGLLTWLQKTTPRMAQWVRHVAICSLLLLELAFSIAILVFGSGRSSLPIAAALLLFLMSLAAWLLFRKSGGCPCFGTMPYAKKFNSMSVCAFVLCAVLLLYLTSSLLQDATFYCVVLVAMVVAAFSFGRAMILSVFIGSSCNIDIVDELVASEIVGVTEDTVLLLFFLKKRCPACVILIAYVQKISAVFYDKVKFILVIDGFSINETVKLAEAYVVPDSNNVLKARAKIFSSPTLVAMRGKVQKKYVGLNACSQGISDLIYSTL